VNGTHQATHRDERGSDKDGADRDLNYEQDITKLIDLEMLALPGGRERTAEEFAALFAGAGFELTRIIPTKSPLSVIEAQPR